MVTRIYKLVQDTNRRYEKPGRRPGSMTNGMEENVGIT
jgi:hypothetical protein